MEKNKITKEIRNKLREPFPPEALGTVASKSYLTSIKAMYVVERLNEVFGIGRWTYIHEVIKEIDNQVLIQGELKILDYECIIPKHYGSHKISGKGVEIADGYEPAITDGLTKSASYIEIGIDVFKGRKSSPKNGNNSNVNEPENWLNAYKSKDKKTFTDDFINVMKAIKSGKYSIIDIRKKYKISKETAQLIETLKNK